MSRRLPLVGISLLTISLALPALAQNDLPPDSAKPGECYAKVLVPAQFQTAIQRVQTKPESTRTRTIGIIAGRAASSARGTANCRNEGPREGTPVLMMHGEPSWCYLYRHMIGPVVEAGYRVLAPDLIGFGKSDKLTKKSAYSYALHVAWMRDWLDAMELSNIVLACQDWGSLVGLRLVADMPDRFAAVVLQILAINILFTLW